MPEVYDIGSPVPDDPKKKDGAATSAKSTIQIGSAGNVYKSKRKKPKPTSPRVIRMRLIGLGTVIVAALAFIVFQMFAGKKPSEGDGSGKGAVANPNIAAPTAIKTPAKPTYRPPATYTSPKKNVAPGFNLTPADRGAPQSDQGEGIH